jgi:hypothetical protein
MSETPGTEALSELADSIASLDGIDAHVAQTIEEMMESGRLKAESLVEALRSARRRPERHDED